MGILKIRNDLANLWIGYGELAKFSNLFSSQFHDHAYRILLEREDLFRDSINSIVQYIYELVYNFYWQESTQNSYVNKKGNRDENPYFPII